MKQNVLLTIRGEQRYADMDPEVIELVTEGTMEEFAGGWDICYEESDLTGLQGVMTTFHIRPDQVVLDRTGKLHSQMVFREGVTHDSLYQMEFGALMISVCANKVRWNIDPTGGEIEVIYSISVEESAAGTISYHITIQGK